MGMVGRKLRTGNEKTKVNEKRLIYDVHRLDGKLCGKTPIFPRQLQSPTRNHNPLR